MTLKIETAGRTALRVAVGATMVAHGTQKLFGWFGGPGLEGTGGFFHSVGFRPGGQHAVAAGLSEAGGGALLALGLATPAAGAAMSSAMVVASSMHTDHGFFAQEGGYEYPAVLGVLGASFAATGPGPISLDGLTGHALDRPWMRVAALAAILPGALSVIRRRRTALAADADAANGGPA